MGVTNNEGKLPDELSKRSHTEFMQLAAYLSRYVLRHGELSSISPYSLIVDVTMLVAGGLPIYCTNTCSVLEAKDAIKSETQVTDHPCRISHLPLIARLGVAGGGVEGYA